MAISNGSPDHRNSLSEAHEERILRLEGSIQQIASKQAESLVKLEYLGDKVDSGLSTIVDKIDKAFGSVNQRLDTAADKLTSDDKRLTKVEDREVARLERATLIKKITFPLMIAAGSVGATHFGQILLAWLTR